MEVHRNQFMEKCIQTKLEAQKIIQQNNDPKHTASSTNDFIWGEWSITDNNLKMLC